MTEAEFAAVRQIRMMLRDPLGVNDLVFADSALPNDPDTQTGYYDAGLGKWQKYNERKNCWERLNTKLSDAYIIETVNQKGMRQAALCLIDFIIMGLQSGAVSFSAGAESVSRSSLSDQLALYREQKKILLEQAGMNTGRTMKTRQPVIGGVKETW